jgi:type I restriction enzyme S subunit
MKTNSQIECQLGDVIELGNGKVRPTSEGDIPVYGGNGILGYCDQHNYEGETIIIGRVGAYCGSVFYENRPIWVSDNALAAKAKDDNSLKYLYYFLKGLKLNDLAEGSSHPLVTQTLLNSIETKIAASGVEQKAIAGVLSSLDDKIDLLHRQNKTLESMAETLFRQWFIEEAKDDWEEKPLSSIAVFLNGIACQKFPPKNDFERLPVLKIRELKEGISENSDWVTSDINTEYIVENGDVIFSWSASLLVKFWDGQRCVLNQHLFKVTSNEFPKWFFYYWCKYHLDEFIAISSSHATTMGHIKRGDLDAAAVFVPDRDELKYMDSILSPLISKIIENNKQSLVLEKLRDMLLPKLMNGEIKMR